MAVLVVRVRVVGVAVAHRAVVVCVGVHLAGGQHQSWLVGVGVLVVQVVAVRVDVVQRLVIMGVRMVLRQVQPQA